ncbi:fimbria/pilus outer membrane usher protein [Ramlibacter sp. AN1015]|uniref:fimbria/pilus outer membrane usher protein n=1 Tax=Ramlibacter sp. AN1015 TaxID=3133428 RepID=UPI0030C514CC
MTPPYRELPVLGLRRLRRLALAALLGVAGAAGAAGASEARPARVTPASTGPRALAAAVVVNGTRSGDWLLLQANGQLHATREAWQAWRLRAPADAATFDYQDQTWFPLAAWPGFASRLEDDGQQLQLQFEPQAFEEARIDNATGQGVATAPREHALFLNYDASANVTRRPGHGAARDGGTLAEVGWTGPWGFLTTSHALQWSPAGSTTRRLETSFTHDQPGEHLSWRVGDSSTRPAFWSRPAYFAGLQFGKNFRLDPGFISQPIPVFAGSANAPSTLELYVNDVLQQTAQVPPGPFSLQGATGLTRAGQARLVLRDALGRESVVVSDFFGSPNLLEEDLSDWSAEIGALREGLGGAQQRYGRRFGAVLWRRGLSKTVTVETRAELSGQRQAAGAGLLGSPDGFWFGQGALALSRSEAGTGWRALLQLDADPLHQRFAARLQTSSAAFRELGQPASRAPARREASFGLGLLSLPGHTLRLIAGQIRAADGGSSRTLGLVYSRGWRGGYFSVSANQARAPGRSGHTLAATWTFYLDRTQFSSTLSRRDGDADARVHASSTPHQPDALGWRVAAGKDRQDAYAEASLYRQTRQAWLSGDLGVSGEQQRLRLGARGALALVDGSVFATQRLDDSFALVEVPGHANVRVDAHGRTLGVTDARGRTLAPALAAFTTSRIRLDGNDLPITAELDSMEHTVTPARRSAVKVTFPVRSGRGALLQIVLADGEPAPLGAHVRAEGDAETFVVGHRGAAFVSGLQDRSHLVLRWKQASCRFEVVLPPVGDEDITRVGPLVCQGVAR